MEKTFIYITYIIRRIDFMIKKFNIITAVSLLCLCSVLPVAKSSTALAAKKTTKKVSITFSKSTDTIENGKSFTFKAKVKNAKASKVVWKSSNTKVLSIQKKTGKATAKKAGKATITATIGKKLVRRTVVVSPSVSDLTDANDTYKNLKNGTITSVYCTAAGNTAGASSNLVYEEYSCLDDSENMEIYRTVENSYFTYIHDGISYTIDYAAGSEVTTAEVSDDELENNNFIRYSNAELLSAEILPDNNYSLVYMADIDGMTEAEQASVGLESGICVITVVVEPEKLLVQSYKITNYGDDGASAATVSGAFVYDGGNGIEVPEEIRKVSSGSEE
jgi:hypothetical protein